MVVSRPRPPLQSVSDIGRPPRNFLAPTSMAWKILTSLTAVCLAVAATFSFLNMKDLEAERELLKFATDNRDATVERKRQGDEKLTETKESIVRTQGELEQAQQDLTNTNSQISDKEIEIARLRTQLQESQARVAQLEEQIQEAGGIEELLAETQELQRNLEEAQATIASRQQQLAIATNRLADLTSSIRNYQELEGRQRAGRLAEDFQARVTSVFPDWGFVILDRGNLAGAYSNATLEVRRGGDTVGQLRIGNVEQQVAFADVVPNSFEAGDMPRPGDVVVPAAVVAGAPAPDAAPGFGLPEVAPAEAADEPDAAIELPDDPMADDDLFGDPMPGAPMDDLDQAPMDDDLFGDPAPGAAEPMDGGDPFEDAPAAPGMDDAGDAFDGAPAAPAMDDDGGDPFDDAPAAGDAMMEEAAMGDDLF